MPVAFRALAGASIAGLLLVWPPEHSLPPLPAPAPASSWGTRTDDGAIGEADYWRLVAESLRVLDQVEAAPPESAAGLLSPTIAQWETVSLVTLEDGTDLPLAQGVLLSLLTADPPRLDGARRVLQHMQQAHSRWPAPLHGRQALERLARVLSRSEFNQEGRDPGPLSAWLDSLRQRLLELWYGVLDRLATVLGSSPALRWAVLALGGMALAWITARALRRMMGGVVQEAGSEGESGEPDERLSAQQALRVAQEQSQAGDHRSAVRYLYMSSLISLEERGILRHDRSRTNREYLRMLADHPEVADLLREVVEVFDRVWYGFQRLNQDSFARYAARVNDLLRSK